MTVLSAKTFPSGSRYLAVEFAELAEQAEEADTLVVTVETFEVTLSPCP